MVSFTAEIHKFAKQGEKTGWTYIAIPAETAERIYPGMKKSFRVKGMLDDYPVEGLSLIPMGGGDFILALNAGIRKKIRKKQGESLNLQFERDTRPYVLNQELMDCLNLDPKAIGFFKSLAVSHQNYFSKWIESAKTENTKQERIASTFNAMLRKQGYAEMLRARKKEY
ncbi:MAG TPA: YdeI/OmpD-associated family protein [Saprospiraceae bacterium]|nr:YdeI/OmpD-associated family protein [Saprospiraceae bacterium]